MADVCFPNTASAMLFVLIKYICPAFFFLLFLGRLCGFIQSKPGAALDDPWPTGRVKGSARTPLPVHVSLTHTLCRCLDSTFVIVLLMVPKFPPQTRGSKYVTKLHGRSGNVSNSHSMTLSLLFSSSIYLKVVGNCFTFRIVTF